MTLESIGKFIGPDEVVSVEVTEDKTPKGNNVVKVFLKSGRNKIYPENVLEYVLTDTVSDYNTLQMNKFTPVIRQFMEIVAEYDLNVGEVEPLLRNIAANIDNSFNRATNFLWSGDDGQFAAGFDPMYSVSLLQAHKIIKGIEENGTK